VSDLHDRLGRTLSQPWIAAGDLEETDGSFVHAVSISLRREPAPRPSGRGRRREPDDEVEGGEGSLGHERHLNGERQQADQRGDGRGRGGQAGTDPEPDLIDAGVVVGSR
jgi:hypothetical protein